MLQRQNIHDSDKIPKIHTQIQLSNNNLNINSSIKIDDQSLNQIESDVSVNKLQSINNDINYNSNNNNNDQLDNNLKEILSKIEPAIDDSVPKQFDGPKNPRQLAIVNAFKHSWKGYKEYAWGHDNLKPISMSGHDWFGLGLTIVDSLDTMYMMNLIEGWFIRYFI